MLGFAPLSKRRKSHMRCQFCGYLDSRVIDSRPTEEGSSIRRRRECLRCGKRFTTYEIIEATPLYVTKKGGSKEIFDPDKVAAGDLTIFRNGRTKS